MKYEYGQKWGSTTVTAQIVGEEIEELVEANGGALLPDTVLKSAKRKNSRLHPCFEWDDKKAAHKFRLDQATQLMRSVVVEIESDDPKDHGMVQVRAFPNIEGDDGSYYTTTARVLSSPEMTDQLDIQILRELTYLRNKHKAFKQFQKVWKAIDQLA